MIMEEMRIQKMKKLVATVYIRDGMVYSDQACSIPFVSPDGGSAAVYYSNTGRDVICLLEFSDTDQEHEKNLACMKALIREAEIPVYAGGLVKRFEDIKKYLYTGAEKAVFLENKNTWENALSEASSRFGAEKLIYGVWKMDSALQCYQAAAEFVQTFYLSSDSLQNLKEVFEMNHSIFAVYHGELASEALKLFEQKAVLSLGGRWIDSFDFDAMAFKRVCQAAGLEMLLVTARLSWEDLKKNTDGLIPVVVQEDQTQKVLMLAYMDQEAFEQTIQTGRMTYYSRSRQQLWVKGLTSGHFQYVKELTADCDFDTLLARVSQVGAACHTGSYTCFFHTILDKKRKVRNPLEVLEAEYAIIADRKEHPKEGSYTNYLFEKGIDKILKKVGEEAAEIIIAAKNPNTEEVKYEMADFLYHAMVMMVECGITWEEVIGEIANR